MRQKMKIKRVILLTISLLLTWGVIYCIPVVISRMNPESGARFFADTLQKNDALRAKLLVNAQKRDGLRTWMNDHTPVTCGFSRWRRTDTIFSQSDHSHWQGSASLLCETMEDDGFYCLYIGSVEFRRSRLGWEIAGWSSIYEGRSRAECANIPPE